MSGITGINTNTLPIPIVTYDKNVTQISTGIPVI